MESISMAQGTCGRQMKKESKKKRNKSQIKKSQTEVKDKLIKKGQPIAQRPPNATKSCIQRIPEPTSFHPLVVNFGVVSLSPSEGDDEKRGMVSHMHKDGVSRSHGQISKGAEMKVTTREVILSSRRDGGVDVHLLLDFRARGDVTFDGFALIVYSFCHLKFFFGITVNGIGRIWPIAAGRTPRARCTLGTRPRRVCAPILTMRNAEVSKVRLVLHTVDCLDRVRDVRKVHERAVSGRQKISITKRIKLNDRHSLLF
jgi:hypothetical protein